MTDLYSTNGKEILRNGVHFGDADSEDAARQIVAALNGQDTDRASIIAYLHAEAKRRNSRIEKRVLNIAVDAIKGGLDRS